VDTSDSTPNAEGPASQTETASTFEKWLVRILLGLAFGVAFGIEGMTLVRSYILDRDAGRSESAAEEVVDLREGDALVPGVNEAVRVRRMRVLADDDAWTFVLVARPDSSLTGPYALSLEGLTMDDGTVRDAARRHTWAPGDTTTFETSWPLPPGRRPATLTVSAKGEVAPDSTVSVTRTVGVGHVAVRMQRD